MRPYARYPTRKGGENELNLLLVADRIFVWLRQKSRAKLVKSKVWTTLS